MHYMWLIEFEMIDCYRVWVPLTVIKFVKLMGLLSLIYLCGLSSLRNIKAYRVNELWMLSRLDLLHACRVWDYLLEILSSLTIFCGLSSLDAIWCISSLKHFLISSLMTIFFRVWISWAYRVWTTFSIEFDDKFFRVWISCFVIEFGTKMVFKFGMIIELSPKNFSS